MPTPVCVYGATSVDLCMYRWTFTTCIKRSWYKLLGGCILVQITPLQDFGAEMGVGVYSEVGLYSEYYGAILGHDPRIFPRRARRIMYLRYSELRYSE